MNVLVTEPLAEEAVAKLKKEHKVEECFGLSKEGLKEKISNFDALIVRGKTKVRREIIESGVNLKVIGRAGIGVDNIDLDAAKKRNITVVNAPGGSTFSVAELAIGHLLSAARFIPQATEAMKKGEWPKKRMKGIELYGKVLGLVGSGRIGTHVANIAKSLKMSILIFDPYLSDECIKEIGAERCGNVKEVCRRADFISIHAPLTEETRHIIGKEIFEVMKPDAFIVSCARGGIIDEDALYEALVAKKIRGAALDVFEREPPKESVLLNLDNFTCTPHLGASTVEAQIKAGTVVAEQVLKVLRGEKPDFIARAF